LEEKEKRKENLKKSEEGYNRRKRSRRKIENNLSRKAKKKTKKKGKRGKEGEKMKISNIKQENLNNIYIGMTNDFLMIHNGIVV
jgi:hypothetical protein